MRALAIVCLTACVAFVKGLTVETPPLHGPDIPSSPSRSLVARVDDIEVIYHKATCKGQKILSATTSPHDAAAAFVNPIDSPWTNPIQQELETWGYKIESDGGTPQFRASHEDECEFEHSHKYILSTPIINDETVAIIKKILQDNCLDLDELISWSGCEFGSDEPEYLALLAKLYLGSTFWRLYC